MTPQGIAATIATADGGCPAPVRPEGGRVRRLYLAYQRHELLAPVNAIVESADMLLEEPSIRACERFAGDLRTIRDHAGRMARMIDDVMGLPEGAGDAAVPESLSKTLNHDLRGFLTVVLGCGEDLLRYAGKAGLEAYRPELEQILRLGRQSMALIDELVAYLRRAPGVPAADHALGEIDEVVQQIAAPADDDAPHPQPGRLLVAEDNEAIRLVLARHLRRQGHDVTVASDGAEALEKARSGEFDLVLLDIVMPHVNGLSVLSQMKADPRLRDVPVIMVSGLGDLDGVVRCIEMGAEDYLPKPFNRVLLRARVDACLEKKRLRDRNEQERRRYDELLHVILPARIVSELRESDSVRARRHEDVAVLFADVVGFTPYSDRHDPEEVFAYLQDLAKAWEEIALGLRVQKIKTIGDAFMAAAGLLEPSRNPVLDCVRCGLAMIDATRRLPIGWDLRVGVHIGPVVAGILGSRQYLYDLFGDTVNTSARLQTHGDPGAIALSAAAWQRVAGCCQGERHDVRKIKGKGPIRVVLLDVSNPALRIDGAPGGT